MDHMSIGSLAGATASAVNVQGLSCQRNSSGNNAPVMLKISVQFEIRLDKYAKAVRVQQVIAKTVLVQVLSLT
jgi:hypothetical protein